MNLDQALLDTALEVSVDETERDAELGGNTALGDNIVVNGGGGTVFNDDPLMIAAPQTITGNYDQSAAGVLDFGIAGDMTG